MTVFFSASGRTHLFFMPTTVATSYESMQNSILQHNIYAARPYSRFCQLTGEMGFASKYPVARIALMTDSDSRLSEEDMNRLIEKYTPDYYAQIRIIFPPETEAKRFMDYAIDYRLIHSLHKGLPLNIDVMIPQNGLHQ